MPTRAGRHLELLRLSQSLQRYADSLGHDPNASSFLVHRALSAAFAEPSGERASDGLEASLRKDIARFAREGGEGPCATLAA